MEVSSGAPLQAMKKAEDVQEQAMMRLLNDSTQQLQEQREKAQDVQKTSGARLTGLGTGLDITG